MVEVGSWRGGKVAWGLRGEGRVVGGEAGEVGGSISGSRYQDTLLQSDTIILLKRDKTDGTGEQARETRDRGAGGGGILTQNQVRGARPAP